MNKFNSYITAKSDVGTFSYDNVQKPYAVTGASAASGTISSDAQDITYYTCPRSRQIAEGAYTLDFTYGGPWGGTSTNQGFQQ